MTLQYSDPRVFLLDLVATQGTLTRPAGTLQSGQFMVVPGSGSSATLEGVGFLGASEKSFTQRYAEVRKGVELRFGRYTADCDLQVCVAKAHQ